MPEINIKSFSCIRNASIALKKLNVIIGPQGSGKSVTTKLVYFFADIPLDSVRHAEDGSSFSDYKKIIQKRFALWFPPIAWGDEKFFINYSDHGFGIRIMRKMSGGKPTDEVNIRFSKHFEEVYNFARNIFAETRTTSFSGIDDAAEALYRNSLETSWRTRDKALSHYKEMMGAEVITDQTFIPAGRAFFTSIGRLVAGIEHAGSLDPATLRFAKLFANWRDRSEHLRPHLSDMYSHDRKRNRIMGELFDGVVQSKRDLEYIEMSDGRRVPFSSLSSGQQELLPLWYFLDNILLMDELYNRRTKKSGPSREKELVYIEEPEAHLFPEAQSKLLETLVEVVVSGQNSRSLIITTHSPYIMTKLNVLLKAGQISKRRKRNRELNRIVRRSTWLSISDLNAMSISDGKVSSILDDELEMVDATFLDSISDSIAEQFGNLLDLEDEI